VQQTYQRAITAAEASGNVVIAAGARYQFAMLQAEQGELGRTADLLAAAERFALSQPNLWPWPIVDSVQVGMGRLCYERDELAPAQRLLQQGLDLAQRRRNLYVLIDGYLALTWVQQAQGAGAAAQEALDQAAALARQSTRPDTLPLVSTNQAQLWLAQGDWERALQ
jgi:tetratricopeptide (TPR) repeat protein